MSDKKPKTDKRIKHGLFVVGLCPRKLRNVERNVGVMSDALKSVTLEQKGTICIGDLALINSAARWERVAQCCHNWLRAGYDEMTPMERLAFAEKSARASSERDKCIAKLRLDLTQDDELAGLPIGLLRGTIDADCYSSGDDEDAGEEPGDVANQLDSSPVEGEAQETGEG